LLWVWLYRIWPQALNAMVLVMPATVIQWHRNGFRLYWLWRTHPNRLCSIVLRRSCFCPPIRYSRRYRPMSVFGQSRMRRPAPVTRPTSARPVSAGPVGRHRHRHAGNI
jgi:hypothetical protein